MSPISLSIKEILSKLSFKHKQIRVGLYFSGYIFYLFFEMGFDLSVLDSKCTKEKCLIEVQPMKSDSVAGGKLVNVYTSLK